MNVGIPGTGIGGLFYLVSGIVMIVYELVLMLLGRSTKERVRFVLRQAWLIFLVIIGLAAVDAFLILLLRKTADVSTGTGAHGLTVGILSVRPVVYGVCILAGVLLSAQILSWYFRLRRPIPAVQSK